MLTKRFGANRPRSYIARCYATILTCVPMPTNRASSSTSLFCIRMQPLETALPMEDGLFVPWMPMCGAERPSQRVPNGPPGLMALLTMENVPLGVGVESLPTATG